MTNHLLPSPGGVHGEEALGAVGPGRRAECERVTRSRSSAPVCVSVCFVATNRTSFVTAEESLLQVMCY